MRQPTFEPGAFAADPAVPEVDPNLVWADATQFSDFRRRGEPMPLSIPVIVELADGRTPADLHDELAAHPGCTLTHAYLSSETRYCTAQLTPSFTRSLFARRERSAIERFELQLPVIPERARPSLASAGQRASVARSMQAPGRRLLIGVIDSGCPFAHARLRDASGNGTRVLNLWDQDARPRWRADFGGLPADFGYGNEVPQEQLNRLMSEATFAGQLDEEACYHAARGTGSLPDELRRASHGGFVLDVLAGPLPLHARISIEPDVPPSWLPDADDIATHADIVFVQLPRDAVQDSSSASLPRCLLDGLRYIVGCAGPDTERIVVNISDGSSRGSHDGNSIIERAMVALVSEQRAHRRALHIVLPAGNSFDEERHAQSVLKAQRPLSLRFRLPPGCEAASYVHMYLPPSADDVEVRLVPPGVNADEIGYCVTGTSLAWPSPSQPQAAVIHPAVSGNRLRTPVLLAFAPTSSTDPTRCIARSGDWRIDVMSKREVDVPVHAYVSRNQVNPGALPRGRQARFVDNEYDPTRFLRELQNDPAKPVSPITRRGTLNSLATIAAGQGIVVVGGYCLREGKPSPFSSSGPAAGTQRNRRMGPDVVAVADESHALPGIRAAGNRSGETVRMRGTSFAGPQAARVIANAGEIRLSAKARPADPERGGSGPLPV